MNPQFYNEYYHLEREGWWFRARLNILESMVKIIAKDKPLTILNVGAATGATSEMLSKYGKVTSLEYDAYCCRFLKEKTGIEAVNASLTDLPFEDESFELICAFDVIEHIEDDQKAVDEIYRVLAREGKYFVTVPAFMFLWSKHDEINHHYRRYKKRDFNQLFFHSGLTIDRSTYFNFLLFLPIATIRLMLKILPKRKSKDSTGSDNEILKSSWLANHLAYTIFHSEKKLITRNITFPFGVSILSIGTKK